MKADVRWPVLGSLLAVVITATMDATGLSTFSALPLFPLAGILWFAQRLRRTEVGFTPGHPKHYGFAVLHAVAVIGALTLIAIAAGVAHPAEVAWQRPATRMTIQSVAGVLAVLLTEEGFFRGWLWGSLRHAGVSERGALLWSSVVFMLWHVSAVTLETGFNPPRAQIPTFLVNVVVLGAVWGLLRSISGSIFVSSVAHSLWNAVAYSLYGFGSKAGVLGIRDTSFFAPEVGVLGLVLNIGFAAVLALVARSRVPPKP